MTNPVRTAIDSEALGAFAHDMNTPLNAVSMVIEVARRTGDNQSELTLDEELTSLLMTSVKELTRLVGDMQDVSRIERGKQHMAPGPASLSEVVATARENLGTSLALIGDVAECEGPWDRDRLGRMIADLARSANRCGAGNGEVEIDSAVGPNHVSLMISSGTPGQQVRNVTSDAGWGFFRARALILAMGGNIEAMRTERYLAIDVTLPR